MVAIAIAGREPRPETVLTLAQLAELIGPRVMVGGVPRPTAPDTLRRWCLQGRKGVRLRSWLDVCVRKTTWGDYQAWLRKVQARAEELRQVRNAAVEAARTVGRRAKARRQAQAGRAPA